MATSQVSAQARGVIVVLEGKAWVLDSSGNRVLLKVGDEVQEGQVIVTDTGSTWECDYCAHQSLCATTEAGRIPIETVVSIGEVA